MIAFVINMVNQRRSADRETTFETIAVAPAGFLSAMSATRQSFITKQHSAQVKENSVMAMTTPNPLLRVVCREYRYRFRESTNIDESDLARGKVGEALDRG